VLFRVVSRIGSSVCCIGLRLVSGSSVRCVGLRLSEFGYVTYVCVVSGCVCVCVCELIVDGESRSVG